MAQLAIRGHATRGKEVIEILEMLGGKSYTGLAYKGEDPDRFYCINKVNNFIDSPLVLHDVQVFTLEEFLEKFPYKVGDKVWLHYENLTIRVAETITCMRWCNKWDYVLYDVTTCCNLRGSAFTPYKEETMEEIKVDIPKGYEFVGVDDDKHQVVFTRIQPQYPKTYWDCAKFINRFAGDKVNGYNYDLILNLQRLLICRDAYWKIAGEQMGLGKPWKPDWDDGNEEKYCIEVRNDNELCDITYLHVHRILAFPTMELLDIFAENFKELIESCKELL